MARKTDCPDGIESLHVEAKFVGNGMDIDEWDSAMVWTPETPEVEEGVSIDDQSPASGKAPAVNGGQLFSINKKVEGWNKYELTR